MTEYIIFAVGCLVMLMVCSGLFYMTATEMVSHSFHKTDVRRRPETELEKSETQN